MNPRNTKIYLCLLFALFLNFTNYAQKNSEKGDRYFDQNQFEMAIKYYQMDIHAKNRRVSSYALEKMANCYRISGEFEKAEETFKKILKRKKKEPLNYLNYGLALKNSAKYAEASVQLQEYVKLQPEDLMGKVYLQSCDSAQRWLDETIGKEVKNLEKINTELSEFSPTFYTPDNLFFSSSREGSKKALISFDGGGDVHRLDLYSVNVNDIDKKENKTVKPLNFKEINTAMHEGPACFSSDGNEIYFTKTVKGKRDSYTNEILGTLQVFHSIKDSAGKWSIPTSAFPFNSIKYSVGHPSLSKDGQTIYYMSDKPGGYGKTDIYYSTKLSDGVWSPPINAGNEVNTFGNEMFPTISVGGDLYFSSNAHPGMGQLDVFKSTKTGEKWGNVHNLKPPINSIANDFGIVFDGEEMRGFFSSDRFNGKGAEDIYSFSEELPLRLSLTNDSLLLRDLSVFDDMNYSLKNETDSTDVSLELNSGIFSATLEKEKTYTLKASRYGMKYNEVRVSISPNVADTSMIVNVASSEKEIIISGSFFIGAKNHEKLIEPTVDETIPSEESILQENSSYSETEISVSKEGVFTFKSTIPSGEEKTIRSTDVIREVEPKN
ncbi:hypothetical protein [Aurantibacillus circumpalustris]|uniref:hypothetical protein n=1 Tax=Aurantibacillus circumpalustris TaxID=3036359 RepID=UPI00295B8A82|nr:hypothetical protein [Aurantibacillus circumpalustris]